MQEYIEEGKKLAEKLQLAEAQQKFQSALQADVKSIDALVWLGRLAFLRNQPDEAIRQLDQAMSLQPQLAEAQALKAICFMEKKEYDRAIPLLEEARSWNPELDMIHANLANCYRETGKMQEAEEAARNAIERNPSNYSAHYELGRVLSETGRGMEAIPEIAASIKANPLFLKGYVALGILYNLAGKFDAAIDLYRTGLLANPNAIVLHEQICGLYVQKKDYPSALKESLEIVLKRKQYSDHLRVGMYALAAGQYELAEKAFKQSTEMNPRSWEGHYNLGELYRAANLKNEAAQEYQMALQHGSNEWKPQNGMGLLVLRYSDDPETARNHFFKAMKLAPDQWEPVFNLALACSALRDFEAAEKACRMLLDSGHTDSHYYAEAERLLKAIQTEKNQA